jgi:pimeloyl-ACP methyl ester carboxylesterase
VTTINGHLARGGGWQLQESGPADARHSVLLLPGGLCTTMFYEDLMGQEALAGVRLIAATLPGHGGTAHPEDLSVENYAAMASALASSLGCEVVVGHSLGANVALEMAASGGFRGPLVLLAPSLSRQDESIMLRALDRLGRLLGRLPFSVLLRVIGPAMKDSLPSDRRDALIAEFRKNDPRAIRRSVRSYLAYLDRHGSVASRLCQSDVTAWLVFGDRDDVGVTDAERGLLAKCPRIHLVTIAGAGHMTPTEVPERVAELIVEALGHIEYGHPSEWAPT